MLQSCEHRNGPQLTDKHVEAFRQVAEVALRRLQDGESCPDSQNRTHTALWDPDGWLYEITDNSPKPETWYPFGGYELAEAKPSGISIKGFRCACNKTPLYKLQEVWLPSKPEQITLDQLQWYRGRSVNEIERLLRSIERSSSISVRHFSEKAIKLNPTVKT
jgi:hypothetical protein